MAKIYDGPFGSYGAGSVGAVLNALCEQEGRPVTAVSNYIISNGRILRHSGDSTVVATFVWDGDDIAFNWA